MNLPDKNLDDLPERLRNDKLIRDFLIGDRRLQDREDLKISSGIAALPPGHEPFLWSMFSPPRPYFRLAFPLDSPGLYGFIELSHDDGFTRSELLTLKVLGAIFANSRPATSGWSVTSAVAKALRDVRVSVHRSLLQLGSEIGIEEHALNNIELGAECPNQDDFVYRWCHALGLVCPPKTALVRAVDFSPALLQFLQEDPSRLQSLTPDEFERFVASRLDRMGYSVTLTGNANQKDGGIDLIAVPRSANLGSLVIAGQVKHHRGDQKTGREAVDRLLAWKDSYFGVGLLATNTAFTKDAIWAAQQGRNARFLRLRDFTDLKRWLQDQWGTEEDWREIPDKVELAPGVVIEIPRPRMCPSGKGA
jgi:hypothetical protein